MKKVVAVIFVAMVLCLLAGVSAHAAAKVPEHSLIRPFPGSVLAQNMSKYEKFGAFEFRVKNEATGKTEKVGVKGEYRRLLYEVYKSDGQRNKGITRLEFFENFKAAALEKGGTVKSEDPQGVLVFTVPRKDGGITWCQVQTTNLGQTYLTIVDEQPFRKSLTFGPAEMKAALDKGGRVALYDILFDFDKATLQQSSDKQLQHVLTLLAQNPKLVVEVQGHTDNKGGEAYNLELSQRRAETVVEYLALFGIDKGRLRPKGYGFSKPLASNDTEEGRAKNRRVEIVRIGQ